MRSVQRYKFESNSQRQHVVVDGNMVVAISTKIQIWKQFTTVFFCAPHCRGLLRSVQRYKFESNSQRIFDAISSYMRCCDQYKDTNLKAIHNLPLKSMYVGSVVAISTKIQIWKQFTTEKRKQLDEQMLLRSVQRYKFESNSQLIYLCSFISFCCCDQYKDTNLKAIHNPRALICLSTPVVAISTKIQIWKQFTTQRWSRSSASSLLRSVQRYKFESNSQPFFLQMRNFDSCCDQYKDTNLKAIHNVPAVFPTGLHVVAISTKIQIWKQFTTIQQKAPPRAGLLRSVQRYKFESNSQLEDDYIVGELSCCDQYKDTNLKAIHNNLAAAGVSSAVVAISTKIQIWKQFTT